MTNGELGTLGEALSTGVIAQTHLGKAAEFRIPYLKVVTYALKRKKKTETQLSRFIKGRCQTKPDRQFLCHAVGVLWGIRSGPFFLYKINYGTRYS